MPRNKVVTLPLATITLIIDRATSQPGVSESGSRYEDSPISTPREPTLPQRVVDLLKRAEKDTPIHGAFRQVAVPPDDALILRDWCNTAADKLLRAEKPDQTRAQNLQDAAVAIDTAK
jgi:hypothetical protein